MTVVAMSGLTGGGARLLGPKVAERLESDYVDRLILTNAARHIGATVEALAEREQRPPTRAERFSGLLQRILQRSAVTGAGTDPFFGAGAMALLTEEFEDLPRQTITRGHQVDDEAYVAALRHVIEDLAAEGNVVIVGRGSSFILADNPEVLRVGVASTWEDRVVRIMDQERTDHETAEATIRARDAARAIYYARFLGADDPDDPQLYHMVVNTSEVGLEYSTHMVVEATKALADGSLHRAD
jgi:cytidylate kinase